MKPLSLLATAGLRGSSSPSLLRSEHQTPLSEQLRALQTQLFDDQESIMRKLDAGHCPPIASLQKGVRRASNPARKLGLYHAAKFIMQDQFVSQRRAAELYVQKKSAFLESIRELYDETERHLIYVEREEIELQSALVAAIRHIDKSLNIIKMPDPAGSGGSAHYFIMPNLPTVPDAELLLYLQQAKAHLSATAAANTMSTDQLRTLKAALPANVSPVLDFLVVSMCSTPGAKLALGITPAREQTVRTQVGILLSKTAQTRDAITTKMRAEGYDMQSAPARKRISYLLRKAVQKQKLLTNGNIAAAREAQALVNRVPALIGQLQAAARSIGGHGKQNSDTPVDEIVFDDEGDALRVPGGILKTLTAFANTILAGHGLEASESTIWRLFPLAKIVFRKVAHTATPPRIAQHYCAKAVQQQILLAHLFSSCCVRVSLDAMKLMKCNAGGHLTGRNIVVSSDHADTVHCAPDHDQGGDHLGKLCIHSTDVPPIHRDIMISMLGDSFDPEQELPGYTYDEYFMARPGLAIGQGHVNDHRPETSERIFGDLLEVICSDQFADYFASKDGSIAPVLMIEEDNAHGDHTQFCAAMLMDILDLDLLHIVSHAGGWSKRYSVERLNGALSKQANRHCITIPLDAPTYALEGQMHTALESALSTLCTHLNGATYQSGGGFVDVFEARKAANLSDFQFNAKEIKAFIELKTQAERDAFVVEEMPSYDGDVKQLLLRAHRKMTAVGAHKCMHLTRHTLLYYKNELNPDCLPKRGAAALHSLLQQFNGHMPHPVPSLKPEKQAGCVTAVGSYMDLDERLQLAKQLRTTEGLTAASLELGKNIEAADRYYPPTLFDNYDSKYSIVDTFSDAGKRDKVHVDNLIHILRSDAVGVMHEIKQRLAKSKYTQQQAALKTLHKDSGVERAVVEYVKGRSASGKANKPDLVFVLKEQLGFRGKALQGARPQLLQLLYDTLSARGLLPVPAVHPASAASSQLLALRSEVVRTESDLDDESLSELCELDSMDETRVAAAAAAAAAVVAAAITSTVTPAVVAPTAVAAIAPSTTVTVVPLTAPLVVMTPTVAAVVAAVVARTAVAEVPVVAPTLTAAVVEPTVAVAVAAAAVATGVARSVTAAQEQEAARPARASKRSRVGFNSRLAADYDMN
eukprot:1860-Heterococcus_DN1.PRE.3